MPDTAEVIALRAEITQLKTGTLGLAGQVETLSGALTALNDLQRVQREQGSELAQVKSVVVPREEHARRDAERHAELAAYRRSTMHKLYAYGVLGLALIGMLAVVGANYISGLQQRAYADCQHGNAYRADQQSYLRAVVASSTNPALKTAAERISRNYQPVDCESLR